MTKEDKEGINYSELIDDAMQYIIQKALHRTAENGLPGEHHFFISFLTNYPGVELSDKMRERYPFEITIILQYQFEELIVEEEKFSVLLSFGGVKEKVVVPFKSITAFADPSVRFGLMFRQHIDLANLVEGDTNSLAATVTGDQPAKEAKRTASKTKAKTTKTSKTAAKQKDSGASDNVVKIDFTRKKPKK